MKRCFLLELIFISGFLHAQFAGGAGTMLSPYQIETPEQLNLIRHYCVDSLRYTYFKLTNDIDLRNEPVWEPISTTGAFIHIDGNNNIIKNLHCVGETDYGSFIGVLIGSVRNLGLVNIIIKSRHAGGICGKMSQSITNTDQTRISNCFVTGRIAGEGSIGGITGSIEGKCLINNCYSSVRIENYGLDGDNNTGGIAGRSCFNEVPETNSQACIVNCYTTGYISTFSGAIGGIVGMTDAPILNVMNYADIEHKGTETKIGTIVGNVCNAVGLIKNCISHNESTLKNNEVIITTTNLNSGIKGKPVDGIVKLNSFFTPENLSKYMRFGIKYQNDTLRLLTYNVKVFLNNTYYPKGNFPVIQNFIQEINPDVVCFQEVDSCTIRSSRINQTQMIAGLLNWDHRYAGTLSYSDGRYGIALISQRPILETYNIRLTKGNENRSMLVTEYDRYVVACTHLDLNEVIRLKEVDDITNFMLKRYATSRKHVFLCGDLNAEPGSTTLLKFAENWDNLSGEDFSYPASNPQKSIDFILKLRSISSPVEVINKGVIKSYSQGSLSSQSDHLPVYVELVIPIK